MKAMNDVKHAFKLFGYKENQIEIRELERGVVIIDIVSFRKLNWEQIQYLYENKPIVIRFVVNVKIPILGFMIDKIHI